MGCPVGHLSIRARQGSTKGDTMNGVPIPLKPKVKASHQIYRTPNGHVQIGELGPASYYVENAPQDFVEMLKKLDGTRTTSRLEREMEMKHGVSREDTRRTLKQLAEARVLVDGADRSTVLTNEEIERYDRQMIQFEALEKDGLPGFKYQEKLKETRACVLGMGGWGTWTALLLARIGVGKLRLVDADYVEHSNLNRQILFTNDSIGDQKVAAAAKELHRTNPHVEVEVLDQFIEVDREQISSALDGCNLVVLCWANQSAFVRVTAEALIHEECRRRGVPVMELAGDPFDIGVGPIYDYGSSRHLDLALVQEKEREQWWGTGDPVLTEFRRAATHAMPIRSTNAWQSAPSLSVMAGLAANELLRFLTEYAPAKLRGGKVMLNLSDYSSVFVDYNDCVIDGVWRE